MLDSHAFVIYRTQYLLDVFYFSFHGDMFELDGGFYL